MVAKSSGQLNKTAKHSAVYAFGTLLRRIAGLVMLPIYTRYLTPTDYGVVELLSMAIEIAGILVGLRISQAMFRYYILADDESEKHQVVSTVLFTVVISSCVGAGILYFASAPITNIIFGDLEYIYEFQLFALTLVTNAIAAVGLSYLRARQNPVLFVAINLASLLVQVSLNIVFVVILEMHVTGVVYSALISGGLLATGLSIFIVKNVGIGYSVKLAITLIKFVAPLMLASIGAFYVAYADKYFIRLFGSLHDVGLYALAARISSILATAFEAFNMSWGADRFEIVKNDNANKIFEQVFRYLSAVLIMIAAGLALFANDFFRVMTNPEFYEASNVVPILVLATLARIYMTFCSFGALYGERTSIMAKGSWLKVGVATIGYLLLIPSLGMYGAAIALMLSNVVELVWVHTQSKKYYDMGLLFRPVIIMLTSAILIVSLGFIMPQGEILWAVCRVMLFLLLLVLFYNMPIWKVSERELIARSYKKPVEFIYAKYKKR